MCGEKLIGVTFIVLFLAEKTVSENLNDIIVVSSTQPPINRDEVTTNRFSKLEETVQLQLELMSAKFELKLSQLELQNMKLQKEHTEISYVLGNLTSQCRPKEKIPKNCKEIKDAGGKTDIYRIQPKLATEGFLVLCDMETRGGGWAYVLNRYDGSQEFYLNWSDYKIGFGNLMGEFWMGLEHLNQLTGSQVNELLIELVDWDMKKAYAHYEEFGIGNEAEGYHVKILGKYSGDAGDSFSYHAGRKFSTADRDQDSDSGNCATYWKAAWWYGQCYQCHLTGQYKKEAAVKEYTGIHWKTYHEYKYSLKQVKMMIRPKGNSN